MNDGTYVDIRLGEEPGEPKFCITDILPHLALEQYTRKPNELVKGEEMNILIGSRPFKDDEESERIKLNILNLLYENTALLSAISFRQSLNLCLHSPLTISDLTEV